MADAFFTRFSALVTAAAAPPPPLEPAGPVAAAMPPPAAAVPPPSAISPMALIPREPFGLPIVFWIGSAVFAVIVLIFLASML